MSFQPKYYHYLTSTSIIVILIVIYFTLLCFTPLYFNYILLYCAQLHSTSLYFTLHFTSPYFYFTFTLLYFTASLYFHNPVPSSQPPNLPTSRPPVLASSHSPNSPNSPNSAILPLPISCFRASPASHPALHPALPSPAHRLPRYLDPV